MKRSKSLGTREKQRFQGYLSTPGLFSNPSAPANFFPSKNVGIGGLDRFATDCVTFYSEAKFLLPMRNEDQSESSPQWVGQQKRRSGCG
jgi:hypothetical protein